MAISNQGRRDQPPNISAPINTTPVQNRYSRVINYMDTPSPGPSSAYTPTLTPTSTTQQRLNVVTRVAIEGRAKQNRDGVAMKMYLKISLPLDGVTPGSTIPLFSEENVKILNAEVHPLDNNSVPYNFSSTQSPLLHSAARALNLPPRLRETYQSAFDLQGISTTSTNSSRANGDAPTPIDTIFTGHILVSGYHISYVAPKVFLQQKSGNGGNNPDGESISARISSRSRRSSIGGDKTHVHFMAAINMLVPYLSRPPRSPYLLSIPTPRCLHNNIKLRIFPPSTMAASFASLSSVEEDGGGAWEMTCDPHVTRTPNRVSRSSSYTNFADDESSDSAEYADGCLIQGTFPSTGRVRIRWAKPVKTIDTHGDVSDGRRRVGVKEVNGEVICRVKGVTVDQESRREGVVMNIDYKGACRGAWFPGVATLLGMDIGLEAKGCDVSWLPGQAPRWEISGGAGYTGYDIGQPLRQSNFNASLDSANNGHQTSSNDLASDPFLSGQASGSSSLLKAPLPAQNVGDYSFEGSAIMATSAISGITSISSVSTPQLSGPPGQPVTLHVNMDELLPPGQNVFTFTISGDVLVIPRSSTGKVNGYGFNDMLDAVSLPRFTVLAADEEHVSIIIRNEIAADDGTVELLSSDDKDDGTRHTTIRKGGFAKCPEAGVKLLVRSGSTAGNIKLSPSRPRTPSKNHGFNLLGSSTRPARSGPLMIPVAIANIIPLGGGDHLVSLSFDAPSQLESGWVEFGIAKPTSDSETQTKIEVTSANVDGVPIEFNAIEPLTSRNSDKTLILGDITGREWLSWSKFHAGVAGGRVNVDYLVRANRGSFINKNQRYTSLRVLVPTFGMPVGRLEINIGPLDGFQIKSVETNVLHQQGNHISGCRLLHLSVPEFFYPEVQVSMKRTGNAWLSVLSTVFGAIFWLAIFGCFASLYRQELRLEKLRVSLDDRYQSLQSDSPGSIPGPIVITSTIYSTVTQVLYSSAAPPPTACTVSTSFVSVSLSAGSPSSTPATATRPGTQTLPSPTSTTPTLLQTPRPPTPPLNIPSPDSHSSLSLSTTSILDLLFPFRDEWVEVNIRKANVIFHDFVRTMNGLLHLIGRAYHYPL